MGQKLLLGLLLLTPLAAYPFLRDSNVPPPYIHPAEQENPLSEQAQIALHCFAGAPGTSLAASLPWEPLRRIAMDQSEELDKLAKDEPVKFLERCLAHYEKEVQGYRCVLAKQEKVNGKLRDYDVVRACFREKPFSVHMEWCEGLDRCFATLYVEGDNDGKLLPRLRLAPFEIQRGPILARPLDAADVTSTSRFGINRFGIYFGARDTLDAIHAAQSCWARSTCAMPASSVSRRPAAGSVTSWSARRTIRPRPRRASTN